MAKIWLIGAGGMSRDYMKVLEALKCDYVTIGRGKVSAKACAEFTSKEIFVGGLELFLETKPKAPEYAIVAVPVQELYTCAISLLKYGVKNILIEKPAGINREELLALNAYNKAVAHGNVLLAYNRRFYTSVIEAKKLIFEDGGITSCHFEFTEWSHVIARLEKPEDVFQHWFLGNSTHVVDLAFHLIGKPSQLATFANGELQWHKSGSIFCGAGISEENIPFSYHANWTAPGRWSLELLTSKHRYIFKPMEELRVIKLGTVKEEIMDINDHLDKEFKSGLYLETKNFLENNFTLHCSLDEQVMLIDTYYKIANYN